MSTSMSGAAPISGQTTLSTTAAPLTAVARTPRAGAGVVVKALAGNSVAVFVGPAGVTSANGFPLAAGESISLAVDDPSRIYAVGASGTPGVAWMVL